jgi:exopolyphosphatase/guanosine-5'-triphosphate,3'-diphosphate pyrophosphatase
MRRMATLASTTVGPLAALDIGSNSFRLEIGQVDGPRYRRHLYLKETVRLGAGLDGDGLLTEEAMDRGLKCLSAFAQSLARATPVAVRAVATQTLREAGNRDAFLARAEAALGHPIEVISGREEARLIYTGVAFLQPSNRARLVVDIGGRSTEMILGSGRTPRAAESFQVGCVSLSLRYFADGRLTAAGFRGAQVAAGAELEEALQPFARRHWREALGSSGTAGAVSDILRAACRTDGSITPTGLRWLIERCVEAGQIEKLDLPGLKPERRAVLPGGIAILYTMLSQFGIESLLPAKGALRQGVIVDLDERLAAANRAVGHDLRDGTVYDLQSRFHVDTSQARRVADAALHFFSAAYPDADGEDVNELRWACELHELGLMVSHHDHHRHSAYMLAHVDAPGFSQSQQRRLAQLVLGQRGGLRKVEAGLAHDLTAWQVLCLRLAVIAQHARSDLDLDEVRLVRDGRIARLELPAGWSDAHPRTSYLLREEASLWVRQDGLTFALVSKD